VVTVVTSLVTAFANAASATSLSPPTLVLLSQSAAVIPPAPGQPAPFEVTVEVRGDPPPGAELGLSVYEKLQSRSAFEQTLGGRPSGLMQVLSPEPLTALHPVGDGLQLATTVVAGTTEPPGSTVLGLDGHGGCVPGDGECSGVYPVVVELLSAQGAVLSHLTTYLTYAENRSARPIVFSWIVPVGAPVTIHPRAPLSQAIPPLSVSRLRDLAVLTGVLAANPSVPVTVAPWLSTVQRLEANRSATARATLAGLRTIAASGPGRVLAQPYVPVNLASLSAAGLPAEIAGQTQPEASVLAPIFTGLPSADQPSQNTWVADGPVTPAIAKGLDQLRADQLVLPDTDLAPASEEYHASWSQPFTLDLGRASVRAAAIDTQLSSLFTADPGDPALAAYQLLGELAMIQSELPGAADPRGIVAVPPASWNPNPQFVAALVGGLVGNPVITSATLSTFFATVPIGGNQAATTRRLANGDDPQRIGPVEAAEIVRARTQIDAFSSSLLGNQAVANQLEDLLLTAESSQLRTANQLAGLAAFSRDLSAELASIRVVTSSVTLTAQTATIPVTIVSTADLHLTATLTLSSPKLVFPQGATRTVRVDHQTNSVQVEVRARTTGDLPLSYTLTAPGGALVIAHGRMTVRSTATSIVAIVLTLAAAAVLSGWWARTFWQSRRRRRSRALRGVPA
jgi:hypothetical protein